MPKLSNKNKNSIHININTEKKTKRKRKTNKKSKEVHTHSTSYVNTNYTPVGGILNRSPTDFPNPLVEKERITEQNKALNNYHRNHYLQNLVKRESQLNPQLNEIKIEQTELPMYQNNFRMLPKQDELYDIYKHNHDKLPSSLHDIYDNEMEPINDIHDTNFDNPLFENEKPIWMNQGENVNVSDIYTQAKDASPIQGGNALYSITGRRLNKDGNERKQRKDTGQSRGNYTKKYLDRIKKKDKSLKKNYPSSDDENY